MGIEQIAVEFEKNQALAEEAARVFAAENKPAIVAEAPEAKNPLDYLAQKLGQGVNYVMGAVAGEAEAGNVGEDIGNLLWSAEFLERMDELERHIQSDGKVYVGHLYKNSYSINDKRLPRGTKVYKNSPAYEDCITVGKNCEAGFGHGGFSNYLFNSSYSKDLMRILFKHSPEASKIVNFLKPQNENGVGFANDANRSYMIIQPSKGMPYGGMNLVIPLLPGACEEIDAL